VIDAVAVVEEQQMDFDLEVLFKRTLSEIKQSTSNRVIDTRPYRGDLTKCIPTRG